MSCCDFDNDIYDNKIKKLENNLKNFEKEQNKTNAEIYTLLKQSGVDLSQYYALNEDDYTRTLTSDDDINTLEPGTYKIVKTDMPQNAPTGVASSNYDGTLIQSNSYALLFENGYLHIGSLITGLNIFRWNYVINSNLINIHLQYYMLISRYSDGEFIDDIHTLSQNTTGVYIVNSTTQNLPVQQNGIIIVRIGTATNSLFVTFIPEDSFDVYYCAKKADGTWTEWGQVAFMSDVPSLEGYATQEWVNQQIQDITGGGVTADWVKNNYYALTNSQYKKIPVNTDYNTLQPGCYIGNASNFTNTNISSLGGKVLIIKFNADIDYYRGILYHYTTNRIYFCDLAKNVMLQIAYSKDIPSLSDYATQKWVQSQNYLTEVPDDYATDTEVSQAIATALVGYATQAWVNKQISEITGGAVTTDIVTQMISDAIAGYATQSWVNGRGYQTATQVALAITTALTNYTSKEYVKQNYLSIEKDLYESIPVNSDLNNYITKGNYGCFLSANVPSIQNKPIGLTKAFKLVVEEIVATDQLIQKITENYSANMYYRTYSGGNWRNWEKVARMTDLPNLTNYATKEWVGQQGYQTVQQVNSLINTATADMLTQEDLDTFNYATENWVLQTALAGYAKTTIDDSLATRPSQEFDRFMIRSTDYHGVNAVSGAEGYLVMHMAVDPDSPTKFIRSSGIVANNKYVNTFSTSDESSVGLSTNNEGTVTVVGMSNNAKQMFILVKPDNME